MFTVTLDAARDSLFSSLKRDGINPIGDLYTLTSNAVHSMDDDECIDSFDLAQQSLEHVLTRLEEARISDQNFREIHAAVKKRSDERRQKKG